MRLLFIADLHYSLKQFDWLLAHADKYDVMVIGGDLLDMGSALDADVQIAIVEKYLGLLQQKTRLVVSSGNHDGDSRNGAGWYPGTHHDDRRARTAPSRRRPDGTRRGAAQPGPGGTHGGDRRDGRG